MASKTAKVREVDMTTGKLLPKILGFATVLILTSILQLLFNSADMIVVGQFVNNDAVGAVGATGSLNSLIINTAIGFSVGTGVVIASAYGAKNKQYGDEVLHTAILFSVIAGVVVGAVGFFFSGDFLRLMGTPDAQLKYATEYLEIIFLGTPFNLLYNFGASMLRAVGDTKRPLIYLTIAGVINVIINIISVAVFDMGVVGVAIATIFSQAVSAVLVLITLARSTGFLKFSLKRLKMHKRAFADIVRLGLPTGIQSALFNITNVLLQSSVNSFGRDVVNGCSISGQIEGYIYAVINSISSTSLTVVGQNYGARDYARIKKTIIISTVFVTVASLAIGWLAILCHNPLCKIFMNGDATPEETERIISFAYQKLIIIGGTYFLDGIMEVLTFSLRGVGYSITSMMIVLVGTCAVRILWLYGIFPFYRELTFLFLMYPISWILTLVAGGIALAVLLRRDVQRDAALKSIASDNAVRG